MTISLAERYNKAKAIVADIKPSSMDPSKNYTAKQQAALGFMVTLLRSLAGYKKDECSNKTQERLFHKKALETYKIIHPHRDYIDEQIMLVEITENEDDVVKEAMHVLHTYHFIMLDEMAVKAKKDIK